MRGCLLLLLLALGCLLGVAQEVDTVLQGQVLRYRVLVRQAGSQLFWTASGADLLAASPSAADTMSVRWHSAGLQWLSVYEQSDSYCQGPATRMAVFVKLPELESLLEVPNLFTPNGDQLNDLFRIRCLGVPEQFSLRILNRWGSTVFHSTRPDQSWDGTHNGQPCAEGTYFYLIQFTHGQRPGARNGVLQLLR